MSFFKDFGHGNPFSTQVGQLIEKATDGSQASEDWGSLMSICDIINSTEDGPKDAQRAIKKKLNNNVGKNYTVVMYTLTVLETCVKNCGKRFHVLIAHKDFLQELVRIIGPKNDPPQAVQEKVLSLIQTWADAFQGSPDLKEVGKMYMELKSKGIEFPMTDLDHMAPIHTPARTGPEPPRPLQPSRGPSTRAAAAPVMMRPPILTQVPPMVQQQQQPAPGPVVLGAEQMGKLKKELDVVQQNCRVLSEMLTEMTPGQENPSDLELLTELNGTCRQMQKRMVQLLETVQNEDVTGELLHINDELNNMFVRYDRFERLRGSQAGAQTSPSAAQSPPGYNQAASMPAPPSQASPPSYSNAAAAAGGGGGPAIANLIDLGDTTPSVAQPLPLLSSRSPVPPINSNSNSLDMSERLADMNLGSSTVSGTLGGLNSTPAATGATGGEQDFDMFAQSRQSFEQNKAAINTQAAYSNQQSDQFSGGLGQAVNAKNTGNPYSQDLIDTETDFEEMEKYLEGTEQEQQTTATSSEFDRFLSDRAGDADQNGSNGNNRTNGRQMQKDDQDNALFAL